MVNLRRFGLLLLLSFIVLKGGAQTFSPKQVKLFKVFKKDTLFLDSLSLVPGSVSFRIFPQGDSTLLPEVNYKYHALIFKGKRKPDSLFVSYKRFPYNFEKLFYHKNADDLYTDLTRRGNPFTITYNNKSENLFQNDGLSKNGNISRGISFGNNQDVVVNSNLNLQVSGKLTPEIDLVMAATDNNIPFQADGTTAQLQEFDKVFIQLSNYNTKMVVGDYQLSRPQNSYFMNFYKRAQGFYLENTYRDSSSKKPLIFKTQVSAAVSRGKFSRQVFFGIENNQGPYRLNGADNEPFIIVLSGTEKIYIDGRLLQRGQENDYIIDYNSGELTFTAKQQITKDKRIVAEFQYAERNYARSLFFFGEEVQTEKTKYFLNMYSEQDNKNRPLQQNLDDQAKKNILINAGDSLNKAVYSGADSTLPFNGQGVFYRRTDTIVGAFIYKGVYVYSLDSVRAKYNLKMSYLGPGKGNYNQVNAGANGKVYAWVAPVGDSLKGSYEPVIPLVTPKQNQMLTGGFTHSITPDNTISMEGVYTKNNINEFSTKDKGNDEGGGVKIISRNQTFIRRDSLKRPARMTYNLNYEFVQKNFRQVERFRSIEFDRDWNRPLTGALLNDQSIASGDLGMYLGKAALTYTYNLFNEGTDYRGIRHNVSADYRSKTFISNYAGSYLTTNDVLNKQTTRFYRHKSTVSKRVDKLKFAYTDVFENNQFRNSSENILLPRAYQFWEWEGSVSNADSSKTNVKVFYKERRDKLAYHTPGNDLNLKDSTFAKNIGVQASIFSIKNNPITLVVTYRKLDLSGNITSNSSLKPDNTLLNRLEYNPRYFKGLITSSIFYETGYGQQNKLDYYYLQVAPGQGQYTWVDYNGDGIQEKNEFELTSFPDKQTYIRFYTPTNEYVKVLQNQLSISVNIRPSNILKDQKKAINRFLNRWVLQTAVRLDNKISDNNTVNGYNPFIHVPDTFLLAANNNSRYSVFFNQTSAVFGADYTHIDNTSRQLLTNGIEEKTIYSDEVKWRVNFFKAWAINSDNTISRKGNISRYFITRNYDIKGYQTEQKLVYQPNTVFRLSASYKYDEKRNQSGEELETAFLHTYGFEIKYNQTEKGSLTGKMDIIKIQYNAEQNSPVAYEMLNGLSKGDNYTWELSYQRNLNNNIQISINYSGRKTPGANIVHLGGAQIRAYF